MLIFCKIDTAIVHSGTKGLVCVSVYRPPHTIHPPHQIATIVEESVNLNISLGANSYMSNLYYAPTNALQALNSLEG